MTTFNNFEIDPINKQVSFNINDIDISIVNAIRRVILSEIPNVSIFFDPYDQEKTGINFIKNTTSLHNEFLGHRLSLIPIKLPEHEIENYDTNTYNFEINVHNKTHEMLEITTNDIKIYGSEGQDITNETHNKIFPVSPITKDPILIVKLKPNLYNNEYGDALHVKFKANLGIAKDHARYSPVSTCTYFNVIDYDKANAIKDELIRKAEEKLIDQEGKQKKLTDEEKKKLENRFYVHDAYRYFKTNEFDEPNCVRFSIESECHMTPKYLFAKSIDVLIQKLERLIMNHNQNRKRYVITKMGVDESYHIRINGEQHTIGNLLQCLMYNMFVRKENILKFVGYHLIHPLTDDIILKMSINQQKENATQTFKNEADIDTLFGKGMKNIVDYLHELKSTWNREYDLQMNEDMTTKHIESNHTNDKKDGKKVIRRVKK